MTTLQVHKYKLSSRILYEFIYLLRVRNYYKIAELRKISKAEKMSLLNVCNYDRTRTLRIGYKQKVIINSYMHFNNFHFRGKRRGCN